MPSRHEVPSKTANQSFRMGRHRGDDRYGDIRLAKLRGRDNQIGDRLRTLVAELRTLKEA